MASSSGVVTTENTDDDVFLNGDNGSPKSIASSGDGVISDRKLPRRSSLIKDHTRRNSDKKKTVSFTSLPSEKAIVTGLYLWPMYLVLFRFTVAIFVIN